MTVKDINPLAPLDDKSCFAQEVHLTKLLDNFTWEPDGENRLRSPTCTFEVATRAVELYHKRGIAIDIETPPGTEEKGQNILNADAFVLKVDRKAALKDALARNAHLKINPDTVITQDDERWLRSIETTSERARKPKPARPLSKSDRNFLNDLRVSFDDPETGRKR